MSAVGEINGWQCRDCGRTTYVVHVDDGVTPMFLACRASGSLDDCEGMGVSLMYPDQTRIPAHVLKAVGWEWYRPGRSKTRRLEPEMREHVEKGGLMLRPLTDQGRRVLTELEPSA